MTVSSPPSNVPHSGRPPEDDLDGLLRAYFKAEMPDPWPSFESPTPRNGVLPLRRSSQPPRTSLWQSRLALAAAILLLIAGGLFLLGSPRTPDATGTPQPIAPSATKHVLPEGPDILITPEGASIRDRIPLDFAPMK